MNEKTLEKELTERIEQHKFNVLKMRIKKHYEDLYNTYNSIRWARKGV